MSGKLPDGFQIRNARPGDVPVILDLVKELAEFEKLAHEVEATPELFHAALFGSQPRAFALICEVAGKAVGTAVCFYNFSTFVGRAGIYVEDIYVQPDFRGRGIGRAVFRHIAQRAVAEKCGRMEWAVLDWNEPALKFYESIGATVKSEWRLERLTGAAIAQLAA
jgi:GNAT superfamily N-acetyltransferase